VAARATSKLPAFLSHDECDALSFAAGQQIHQRGAGTGRARTYAANRCIWLADDLPERVYLLQSGRIEISAIDADGAQSVLRVVEPGELFGELCFCAHRNEHLGTIARALTKSTVIENSYEAFARSLRYEDGSAARLLETFCHRVADMERRTRVLTCRNARKRVALALIDLCELRALTKQGNKDRAVLAISHAELADRIAMTRSHTTVVLTRLRAEGLIAYDRTSRLTVNIDRLRKLFG
jgi:CRP/FNR family transcriptional regulator, cyclic AMP receptor protein